MVVVVHPGRDYGLNLRANSSNAAKSLSSSCGVDLEAASGRCVATVLRSDAMTREEEYWNTHVKLLAEDLGLI